MWGQRYKSWSCAVHQNSPHVHVRRLLGICKTGYEKLMPSFRWVNKLRKLDAESDSGYSGSRGCEKYPVDSKLPTIAALELETIHE